jgi:hypothetical protein
MGSSQELSLYMEKLIQRREGRCGVFWGSHGCNKTPYHDGYHICWCGQEPSEHSCLYGPGLTQAEKNNVENTQAAMAWIDAKRALKNFDPDRQAFRRMRRGKRVDDVLEEEEQVYGIVLGA